MARLRLFGPAREAAGTGTDTIEGADVAEVLAEAERRFGPHFSDVLASAKVWLNGTEVGMDTPVDAADEVAVLPPVSGGT
ncbi:MAG TPA: MoaD/ThiS family protein [Acidimicrobiales bacterium]|jgi:molybdopterin converting factor small subunit